MRIVEHDEIPADMEGEVQLLDLSAGWRTMDFHRVREVKRLGYPVADYFGVYAVEGDRILSMVRVLRLPYSFLDGHTETLSAIQGVTTRRDVRGRGLARKLLNEVHARERRAGSSFSLLWTSRSNMAHQLYESLGYRDIYTPDLAARRLPKRRVGKDRYRLETAKIGDAVKIERFHAVATRSRIGFTPRPKGFIRYLLNLRFTGPDSFRLVFRDGHPVGYLELQEVPDWVRVSEVVMTEDSSDVAGVLDVLERLAAGKCLALWNTFVRDSRSVLEGRGYPVSDFAYYSLMALPLNRSHAKNIDSMLGAADPRFVCQALDYF
jgi:GNAT superfamily N-acetyltransferase